MILTDTEIFTAEEAVKAGAADAVNAGSTQIEGFFELTPDGIKFQQKKFVFRDKYKNLRVGVFATDEDLLAFGRFLEKE